MEWICFCFYTVFISSKQEVITVITAMSLLEAKGIRKVYKTRFGGATVEALKNVNFSVEKGEYVAIMGESGSGKTTLLNIIAALDKSTEGSVTLDGMKLNSVKDSEIARFRRENLGFVFQDFNPSIFRSSCPE